MSQYWLIHVFDNLSFSDLHSCYKVCKLWREAATHPGLSIYTTAAHPISTWVLSNLSYTFLTRLTHLSFSGGFHLDWGSVREAAGRLTHILISAFPYLDNLKILDLSGTSVTDQLTKSLLNDLFLPSLRTLNLTNCKLLRDFLTIQTLAQTRHPTKIILGDNHFQCRYNKAPNPTQITFINTTDKTVFPCWLDYSGKTVSDLPLPGGEHYTQNSYETHPWVILTVEGETLMRLAATKDPQVIDISQYYPGSLIPRPQKLVTVATDIEVTIMLHNKTETPIVLYSLDSTGSEGDSEYLTPNSSMALKTFETVPWVISDEEGILEHVTIIATKVPLTYMAVKALGNTLTCTRFGQTYSANLP